MVIEAINTVQIHAVAGLAPSLRAPLGEIIDQLADAPGRLAYGVTRSQGDDDVWIVSGHWKSRSAMEAHFTHPALHGFLGLLECSEVSRIDFNIFHLS
ncbi:antibiotic biosynthesis monooxygenase [Pseudomonas sp. MM211]|uniref:antibiotic biosynthesis monooxygenase family protein n=1 Tax=Pseudomonas sp. MM211 TaxID=2866808 RepID=UPI001CEC13E0|nr:antibiotic biosynthesis monooxygenase family protein [Pseudomonas sp. MM211]UCJ14797.1 antibiotic biosynthesis monooxygenase [Pseudomonas sp. MM211]